MIPASAAFPKPRANLKRVKKERTEEEEEEGVAEVRQILPNLWVGTAEIAFNLDWLKAHGIKRVLNVAREVPNYHLMEESIKYLKVSAEDNPEARLGDYFDCAATFIRNGLCAKPNPEPIVIHCHKGKSRSITFLIAYLIESQRLSLHELPPPWEDMLKQVQNVGFYSQLVQWQEYQGIPTGSLRAMRRRQQPKITSKD